MKQQYIDKLKEFGINISNSNVEEYSNFSIVSFSDMMDGEVINVSVTFFKDDSLDYEIIIRRRVNIKDRLSSLEKINNYNTR